MKYSSKNINYIISLKIKGETYEQIARKFNLKFSKKITKRSIQYVISKYGEDSLNHQRERDNVDEENILSRFYTFLKEEKRIPSFKNLKEMEISKERVESLFGSLEELYEKCISLHKDAKILNEFSFTEKRKKSQLRKISSFKKFLVTTAITGCDVNKEILKSIKVYCKANKVCLVVLPCSDPARINSFEKWSLDPILEDEVIVFKDTYLNEKVLLSNLKLSAKHINPLTGIRRLANKSGAFIFASPKQNLEYLPVQNNDKPKVIITPGTICRPDYETERYMSERTSKIAEYDHALGAFIIEIKNEKEFFFRNIEFSEKGYFYDLDKKYMPDGKIISVEEENFVSLIALGDFHSWESDSHVLNTAEKIVNKLKPKYLTLEDFFSSVSMNHHNRDKIMTLAKLGQQKRIFLEEELKNNVNDFSRICSWNVEKVVMKRGNHELHLDEWLESGAYLNQPYNFYLGSKIAVGVLEGNYAYQYAIEEVMGFKSDKLVWLTERESFKIDGIENSIHGFRGIGGSRRISVDSLISSYGRSNTGHSHSALIKNGLYRNGTLATLNPPYTKGEPNSRSQSLIIQFKGGLRQLIPFFRGEISCDFLEGEDGKKF